MIMSWQKVTIKSFQGLASYRWINQKMITKKVIQILPEKNKWEIHITTWNVMEAAEKLKNKINCIFKIRIARVCDS